MAKINLNRISQIDNYILNAAPFAQPILNYYRDLVHEVCPYAEEKIKWGFPHFDYQGAMMCSIASFKQHCSINFWKASLMNDSKKLIEKAKSEEAMGHLGKIKSLKDLPSKKELTAYIKDAMRLNKEGIKLPARERKNEVSDFLVPDYFLIELKKHKQALQYFDVFPPSHKKEYLQWITEAKTDETRNRRIKTAIEWISEGKGRNWKYERKK